jgi:hypothetical protein
MPVGRPTKNGRVEEGTRLASDQIRRLRGHTASLAHSLAGEAGELAAAGAGRTHGARIAIEAQAKQRLPEVRERLADQGESVARVAQAVTDQVGETAVAGAARAREVGARVASDALPTMRDLATQAATIALQSWEAARSRTAETTPQARRVSAGLAQRIELVRPDADELLQRAQLAADELVIQARQAGDEILARVRATLDLAAEAADATEPVVERARLAPAQARRGLSDASDRAKETGSDALSFALWTAAAAGIVWYVLVNQERRERLERLARSTWGQANELYRDMKGNDEAF